MRNRTSQTRALLFAGCLFLILLFVVIWFSVHQVRCAVLRQAALGQPTELELFLDQIADSAAAPLRCDTPDQTSNPDRQIQAVDGLMSDTIDGWKKRFERSRNQRGMQHMLASPFGSEFFQSNWEPTFSCELMQRLGKWGDGGKWVCNPDRMPLHPVVYSVGSNGDFSFEQAVLEHFGGSVELHTFDPGDYAALAPAGVSYHRLALEARGRNSLAQLAITLGHERIDVLKVDIEGAELTALDHDTIMRDGPRVTQLLVEVHMDPCYNSEATATTVHRWFHGWTSTHEIYSKESNSETGGLMCEFGFVQSPWPDICVFT